MTTIEQQADLARRLPEYSVTTLMKLTEEDLATLIFNVQAVQWARIRNMEGIE